MTDFQRLLKYFRNSEIIVHDHRDRATPKVQDVIALVAKSDVRINEREAALLSAYRPTYYVSAGERTARLDKIEPSKVNGRTVAYYSVVCRNPKTGMKERYCWRYRVQNGAVVLDHAFPVSAK